MRAATYFQHIIKTRLLKTISAMAAAGILIMPVLAAAVSSTSTSLSFTDPAPQSGNQFGYSVSLSQDGQVAVVTAPHQNVGLDSSAGAAYVFLLDSNTGAWGATPAAKLTVNNQMANNDFGNAAYITPDGNEIIVGAFSPQSGSSGSAYIYNNPTPGSDVGWDNGGTAMSSNAILQSSQPQVNDNFGTSVGLSSDGSTAIVGAQNYDPNNSGGNVGAAYIFTNNGGNWSPSSAINPSVAGASNEVGTSVSISADGSTAIVGARHQGGGTNLGYALIFSKPIGGWSSTPSITSATQQITPSDPQIGNLFGSAVSISDDGHNVVVGSLGNNTATGAVYAFNNSSGSWTQTQELTAPDGAQLFKFGTSVAVARDGSSLLVGAPSQTVNGLTNAGESYRYVPGASPGTWTLQNQLFSPTSTQGQDFGWSVSTVNNSFYGNAFVGAPAFDATGSSGSQVSPSRAASTASSSGGAGGVFLYDTSKPNITGASPQFQGSGQQVTISGYHLNPAQDSKCSGVSVYFGTKPVTTLACSDGNGTQVVATVPSGTINSKIKVVTPNGSFTTSALYNVGPSISSFTPYPAGEGAKVTIKGYDLLNPLSVVLHGSNGDRTLTINTALTNTNTALHVILPNDATTGYVTITDSAGHVNNSLVQLLVAIPKITGFSTTTTSVGKTITVKGAYLAGVTSVQFNGASATPVSATNAAVKVKVPIGATTGTVTVTSPSGTSDPSPVALTIN